MSTVARQAVLAVLTGAAFFAAGCGSPGNDRAAGERRPVSAPALIGELERDR